VKPFDVLLRLLGVRLAALHNVTPGQRGKTSMNTTSDTTHTSAMRKIAPMLDAPQVNRYMPGLDGLRALAVFAVIAYHLNLTIAPGGLLGVGIFFVLSGYLITDILVNQWRANGRLNLRQFWYRRMRRLLPALYFMMVVVMAWMMLFARVQFAAMQGDVMAALLYISNWWLIYHHVSYFASFGPPSPLGHLWSLAVEEQFYLGFPLALILMLRFVRRRGYLLGLIIAGVAASVLAMAVLYQPGMDPSRVYYGTDTRAFALLIGSALAVIWPSRQLSSVLSRRQRVGLDSAGLVALLALLLMIGLINDYESFLYPIGFLLLSLITALLVAVLAHPASRLGKLFGWKPLRWLGVRSYGIYLWHYPVIVLSSTAANASEPNILREVLQVVASIALADLSWRLVERPFRQGTMSERWQPLRWRDWRVVLKPMHLVAKTGLLVALGVGYISLVCFIPSAVASSTQRVQSGSALRQVGGKTGKSGAAPVVKQVKQLPTSWSSKQGFRHGITVRIVPTHPSGVGTVSAARAVRSWRDVVAIGDSIMIDAKPYLQKLLPGIDVAGQVGRQMYTLPEELMTLQKEGKMIKQLIVELGTNGPFNETQVIAALRSLRHVQHIVLVNTRVPRPWQNAVNEMLAEVAHKVPHTTLLDWYTASAHHDAYFYPDGVHLNPTGARVFATLMANAVKLSAPHFVLPVGG